MVIFESVFVCLLVLFFFIKNKYILFLKRPENVCPNKIGFTKEFATFGEIASQRLSSSAFAIRFTVFTIRHIVKVVENVSPNIFSADKWHTTIALFTIQTGACTWQYFTYIWSYYIHIHIHKYGKRIESRWISLCYSRKVFVFESERKFGILIKMQANHILYEMNSLEDYFFILARGIYF